jgi:hypothetical protein
MELSQGEVYFGVCEYRVDVHSIITITIIIIYLTASALSPGGSGYYAYT